MPIICLDYQKPKGTVNGQMCTVWVPSNCFHKRLNNRLSSLLPVSRSGEYFSLYKKNQIIFEVTPTWWMGSNLRGYSSGKKKFSWKCIWIDWLSKKRQQIYFTRSGCDSIVQTSLSTQVNIKISHLILKMLYAYEWILGFCIRFLNCYVLIK